MSSVGGVGSSQQIFALLQKLNDVVANGQQQQVETTVKLATLAATQTIDAQQQATANAALDKVV